jgi:monoamine oxidase
MQIHYAGTVKASLKIHFIILGATAAGLTSAIALRRAGHDVTVLEVEDTIALVSNYETLRVVA